MIFSANKEFDDIREAKLQQKPNYEQHAKLEIVNTLLHINGSMKEFAEDIESKMHKAFKSKAGKNYGLSEAEIEMRKLQKDQYGFSKMQESMRDVDSKAKEYIN